MQETGRRWKDMFLPCHTRGDVRLLPGHGRANPKCNSFQLKGSFFFFFFFSMGVSTALLRNYLIFFTWLSPVVICEIQLNLLFFSWLPFYRTGAAIFFVSLYALPLAKTSSAALTHVRYCFRAQLYFAATRIQSWDSSRALDPCQNLMENHQQCVCICHQLSSAQFVLRQGILR